MIARTALSWLALALLAAGGLSSCVRAEKLEKRIARAWCDRAVECGQYPSVGTCMDVTFVEAPGTYIDAAIDAGRIDYNGAQASRCVRAIKKLKCERGEDEDDVLAACQGILSGAVEPDQPCMIAAECVGERSLCGVDPNCSGECCVGECRFIPGPAAEGEPCDPGSECVAGTFCDFVAGICARLPEAGQSCSASFECADGSICDGEICVARGDVGAECEYDGACTPENYCSPAGTCAARAKRGEPCDMEAGDRSCLEGDTICYEGECVRLLAPGEACGDFARPCVAYAHCANDVCTEYVSVGESCGGVGLDYALCYPTLSCVLGSCERSQGAAPTDVCPVPE